MRLGLTYCKELGVYRVRNCETGAEKVVSPPDFLLESETIREWKQMADENAGMEIVLEHTMRKDG
jgi:hypothetical protein